MSVLTDLLKTKKDRLNELDQIITALSRKKRGTSDPAYKTELQISIDQHESEYQEIETEIGLLEKQRLPEKTAEELQKHIVETWENKCHHIDYQSSLDQLQPILSRIGNLQGGTAIFIIPEVSKMRGKWLLRRVQEWTKTQQQADYIIRPLSLGALDNTTVLTELAVAFGVTGQETIAERVRAVADAIFESICDNMVMALEMTIRLPKVSFDLFGNFLQWFLGNIWKTVIDRHPIVAQHKKLFRLVIFVLTDLDLRQLPANTCIEAPAYSCDKCTVVRIAPWEENDVVRWVHKFSGLHGVGCQHQALTDYGCQAHGVGNGVPLPTWAHLRDILQEELTSKIEEMKHGKLAAISV